MVQQQDYKSVEIFLKVYSESKKAVEQWKKKNILKKKVL